MKQILTKFSFENYIVLGFSDVTNKKMLAERN